MSKLFMYGTSLEGMRTTSRRIHQSCFLIVEFLGIPDMRPTAIYFIKRVRASMVMVPNFQPKRSSIVINNYLLYKKQKLYLK